MNTYWETFIFEKGVFQRQEDYSDYLEDDPSFQCEGDWSAPFPNEPGNSRAFGMDESLGQSDVGGGLYYALGRLTRIVVSRDNPVLAILPAT